MARELLEYEPDNKMIKEYHKYIMEYIAQGTNDDLNLCLDLSSPFSYDRTVSIQVLMRKKRVLTKNLPRRRRTKTTKETKTQMRSRTQNRRRRKRAFP